LIQAKIVRLASALVANRYRVDKLSLQRGPERLSDRVIPADPGAAHVLGHSEIDYRATIVAHGVKLRGATVGSDR